MRKLSSKARIEYTIDLINQSTYLKSKFIEFVLEKTKGNKIENLNITLSGILLEFICENKRVSQQYNLLKHTEQNLGILKGKKFPLFNEFVECLKELNKNNLTFNITDVIEILEYYGVHKKWGITQQNSDVLIIETKSAKERALTQSKNQTKKDNNGLLGVSNLAKKNVKKKPKHQPQSIWTVKK